MNPLPTDPMSLAVLLLKSMQNPEMVAGQLSGTVGSGVDFESVRASLDTAGLLISANPSTRQIECHLPGGFFSSLESLLEAPARRIEPLPRFYLADIDYLHTGDESVAPPMVLRYLQATRFYALLGRVADHQGGVGAAKTLVFLHKSKVEITPQYGKGDLYELDDLQSFEVDFVGSDTHQEQKQTIIKMVLMELFAGRSKLPFSELLARFSDFTEKVRASYELYVAEFSFQKIKEEVEREKLDAMVKLNKVFSDIQGQLLAVPVALVLVGGQMENSGNWTSKNVLIWLAALIFAALMDLLIRNQRHTLKAVKQEIDQQREQIATKYQNIAPRFDRIYQEIEERHTHQQWLIRVVDTLVAISLAITTIVLLWFANAWPHT